MRRNQDEKSIGIKNRSHYYYHWESSNQMRAYSLVHRNNKKPSLTRSPVVRGAAEDKLVSSDRSPMTIEKSRRLGVRRRNL